MKSYEKIALGGSLVGLILPIVLIIVIFLCFFLILLPNLNLPSDLEGALRSISIPIFLIILISTILFTLPFALLILFIVRTFRKRVFGDAREKEKILTTGIPAKAIIKSIQMGSAKVTYGGVDERWGAILLLEVKPDVGSSFEVATSHFVPLLQIPQFQPGAVLNIKFDPIDKSKVVIVGTQK